MARRIPKVRPPLQHTGPMPPEGYADHETLNLHIQDGYDDPGRHVDGAAARRLVEDGTQPVVTPELRELAREHPEGRVLHLDRPLGELYHANTQKVAGVWLVSASGEPHTYVRNPNYRPLVQATRRAQEYMYRSLPRLNHAGQCATELDPRYAHLFTACPTEWYIGGWMIGQDGYHTGEFRPNPFYIGDVETDTPDAQATLDRAIAQGPQELQGELARQDREWREASRRRT